MKGGHTPSRNILESLREGSRIAVIRLRSLGDCVLTTPAIELLKRARPDLRIGVVVENRFAAVFEDNPDIETILPPAYGEMLRWRPALSLNLHGGTRSQLLTLASLARLRAGFAHHRGATLYNVKIPRAQEILGEERTVHTAEHLASAMFWLGTPAGEIPRARLFAEAPAQRSPYAVIHPVAAAAYKTWRPEGFITVAERLSQRGFEPVFIGAGADDLTPFGSYKVIQGAPLGAVKTLLAGARLFVGNDSGPAHMACAFGKPVVVLFGRPEQQTIWTPWHAVAARTFVSAAGIRNIEVEAVLAGVDELLAGI